MKLRFPALSLLLVAVSAGGRLVAQVAAPSPLPTLAGPPPATASSSPGTPAVTLDAARRGFTTRLVRRDSEGSPVPAPPPALFALVRYPARPGALAACLSRPPRPAPNGRAGPARGHPGAFGTGPG